MTVFLCTTCTGAKTDEVFNVAVCELAGHLPIYSKYFHPRGQGLFFVQSKIGSDVIAKPWLLWVHDETSPLCTALWDCIYV